MLWRRNRDMAITVRADVKDGEQGVSVTQSIRPLLKDIEAKLPFGYRIDVGGAVEESDKANSALAAVAPVMLVTILAILMLQLQSFSTMTMVLLTAPLGLVGVVPALLVTRAPLGFVAILGVIALSGMIMRNAVILVDQVRAEMAPGRGCLERRGRSRRAPDASGRADRRGHGARHDPAHAQRLLGPDGDRDHGRPHHRDAAHHLLRAGALRRVVQSSTRGCGGSGLVRAGAGAGGMKLPMNAPVAVHRQAAQRRSVTRLPLLLLLMAAGAHAADERRDNWFTVTLENDAFLNKDTGYTNGIGVSWAHAGFTEFSPDNTPPWLHYLSKNLYISTMPGKQAR